MPKCETDPALLEQVNRFMRENGLTISGAAAQLGVGRTTLWRFCDSGKARDDTKALYRGALEKCNNRPGKSVADVAVKAGAVKAHVRTGLRSGLASHELKLIRKACEGVLALLDVYEAQSLGGKV
jgi:hypothetical protein